jgi:hypothetical protein
MGMLKPYRAALVVALLTPSAALAGYGRSAVFPGDRDAIGFGTLTPGSSYTFEAWVQFDGFSTEYSTIFEIVDPNTRFSALYVGYVVDRWVVSLNDVNPGEGTNCTTDGIPAICVVSTARLTRPYHVAVVVTPTNVSFYLDGALQGTLNGTPQGAGNDWVIGADMDTTTSLNSDELNGQLDEVRLWTGARDAGDIACTMNWQLSGSEAGLYAYWPMEEAAGAQTAPDATGHGHSGVIVGDTTFQAGPFALTPSDGDDIGCLDSDGDGFSRDDGDCLEGNPAVHPGAGEAADGIDGDCDGIVDEGTSNADDDGDGYTEAGGDCDDGDAAIHPGEAELPDGADQDCDSVTDEGTSRYDDDGDGVTEDGGDCNDGSALVHPGAPELIGNGVDDDCDGDVDPGGLDPDGDGYTQVAGDCSPSDAAVYPGAPEVANGGDDDCDGLIDEDTTVSDDDGDGFAEIAGDCDDGDATVGIDAPEVANGVDDDCDGAVDEGTSRVDDDGDGVTEEGGDCDDSDPAVVSECGDPPAVDADGDGVPEADDCDDANGWVGPGFLEDCDGVDNNCEGTIDEGCGDDVVVDTDAAPDGKGCGCDAGAAGGAWLAAIALLALRRR